MNKIIRYGLIISIIISLMSGCSSQSAQNKNPESNNPASNGNATDNKGGATDIGVTENNIKLGGFGALSGPVSFLYKAFQEGAQSYFNMINEQGGINGRKIDWNVEDDEYQPSKSVAAAKKLAEQEKIFMMFGGIGTPTALAVIPYIDKMQVPWFMTGTGSEQVTEPLVKRVFEVLSTNKQQAFVATKYLINEGMTKFAFIYQNDDLGPSGESGVNMALEEKGLKLLGKVSFERGTQDYSSHILKLKQLNPEVVFSMSPGAETAKMMVEAKKYNLNAKWSTYNGGGGSVIPKIAGGLEENLVFSQEFEAADTDKPAMVEHKTILKKYYKDRTPDTFTILGYAAAKTLVHALKQAGPDLTREKIVSIIESIKDFETGVSAPITFGSDNHRGLKSLKIFTWKDQKIIPLSEDWIK